MNYRRTLHRQIDSDSFTRTITIGDDGYALRYYVSVATLKHSNASAAETAVLATAPETRYGFVEMHEAKVCAEQQVAASQADGYVLVS
jgi:hypothetical protein